MKQPSLRRSRPWLAFVSSVLCLCACRSETASPAHDAREVVQRWATAFSESDVDAIVGLYAPDASFFGTGSKTLVTTPEQIRSYFQGLHRDKPRGARLDSPSVQVVSDDVVIVSGIDRVSGTKDGSVYHAEGRVTFVLHKRGPAWQIAHFHRSTVPAS